MGHGIIMMAAVACLAQATPQIDVFRDGKIYVFSDADTNVRLGRTTTRHVLMVNDTYFGDSILPEAIDDPLRRKPTTYYHRNGPVGFLFRSVDSFPDRPFVSDVVPPASLITVGAASPLCALAVPWAEPAIGIVGMHSGTIASYAKPMQSIHFYERNPVIASLSLPVGQEKLVFHNIHDAQKRGAQVEVVRGDVRASIEKAPKGYYKFLFVQTCHRIYLEDVEVELITKEGMKACLDSLTPDGVACFHTSSRHLDLAPVVCGAAKYWKFAVRQVYDPGSRQARGNNGDDHFSSEWIFISRNDDRLKELGDSPLRGELKWNAPEFAFYWTDKGANPLKGILRSDPRVFQLSTAVYGPLSKIYKILPVSWSRQLQQWVGDITLSLSRASVAQLERDGVTAEWLRKTP